MLIVSGETVTSAISAPGEVDDYTFTASAGESVIAGVMETVAGSSLAPRIQLLSPTSTVLFTATGAIGNGNVSFNLAASGTYTLRVTDSSGTQTGGYAVSLAKVGGAQLNSGDGGLVTSGAYQSGTIDTADIDIYSIAAINGSTLVATAGELTSQTLDLQMAVFTPSGQNLFSSSSATTIGTTQTLLPATGNYFVVVWDFGFNATGTYNLSVATAPATQVLDADSAALTSGVRRTGTLDAADLDVYTISGSVNGNILISLAEINAPPAAFAPTLQVISPTGALLYNSAGPIGREFLVSPSVSGTYTIIVFEQSQDAVGNYALTAVSTPGAQPTDADSGPVTSGEYKTGTIDFGDIDVYTFNGTAGGSIVANFARTDASAMSPTMFITSPTGAVLFNNNGTVGIGAALNALATTGVYTITLRDSGADHSAPYGFTVVSTPASAPISDADSGVLTSGVRRTGSIGFGDIDVYTTTVPINGNLVISLTETNSAPVNFAPQLIVVAPNGNILTNSAGATGRDYVLTGGASGTYTIMVLDQFQDEVADYAITAVVGLATQPTDADSGPITSGAYRTGAIDPGDVDVYTISANAGGSLLLNLAETSAALELAIVVTSPNGTVLESTSTSTSLARLYQTLTASGTYTITVWDLGADDIGGYGLTAVAVPAGSQPTDADSGPISSGVYRNGMLDAGDIDVYTISVPLGSSFLVSVAEPLATALSVQMIIFDPTGAVRSNTTGAIGTQNLQQNLTVGGTYVIAILDSSGDDVGAYNLTAVNGAGPQPTDRDSGPLSFAENRRGDLDLGDIDVYTLTGTQTSSLLLALSESNYLGASATAELGYVIFRPDGSVLSASTTTGGTANIDNNLTQTGTYTIAIYENGSDEPQVYGFTAVSLAAATSAVGDGGPIANGQTLRGKIDYGDIDAYYFTLGATQSFTIALQDANISSYSPNIVVATPTGTQLVNTSGADGLTYTAATQNAGQYIVFVLDQFGDDTGEYAISVGMSATVSPTTGDSGPLTTTPRSGEITPGDIDIYTVAATAGVNFSISVNETPTGQTFSPRVLVYRPDGTLFTSANVVNTNTINVTSVLAGTYRVIVTENGSDQTGTYSIAVGTNALTTDPVPPRIIESEYRFDRPFPELVMYASEDVAASLQIADFVLVNTTTATTISSAALSIAYDSNTNRITLAAPGLSAGLLPDGNYTLTISGTGVTDSSGNQLDGNANGTGGDNHVVSFFVLAGDLNRDRVVGFDDLLVLAQNYGKVGRSFSEGNIDYDAFGTVGFDDLLALAQNYGKSVVVAGLFSQAKIVEPVTRKSRGMDVLNDL